MMADETALETLLQRLWPGFRQECVGASAEQIEELEALSDLEIPPFYRWFLEKMGRDLGSFRFPRLDFSISTILAKYRNGLVSVDPRYLLIGWHSDPTMPDHLFYDLDARVRDDALVVQRHLDGDIVGIKFETLREMLAWRTVLSYEVETAACVCQGTFKTEAEPVVPLLEPPLAALGFRSQVPTGQFCGIYERDDAALVFSVTPDRTSSAFVHFRLGGASEAQLRKVLGAVGHSTRVTVEVRRWFLDNLKP